MLGATGRASYRWRHEFGMVIPTVRVIPTVMAIPTIMVIPTDTMAIPSVRAFFSLLVTSPGLPRKQPDLRGGSA